MRLRDIIPPHEVRDAAKLASLVDAYRSGTTVTPVVVICWDGSERDGASPEALSGSHRLAALCEVFDDEADLDDDDADVVQVDGDALLADLAAIAEDDDHDHNLDAARALQDLERLANNRSVDFGDLCSSLIACGVLPERAVAALEDQQ